MELQVNGEKMQSSAATLGQLIAERKLPSESLIVEHNARIVKQQEWDNTRLQEGDTIELLNFVGGG